MAQVLPFRSPKRRMRARGNGAPRRRARAGWLKAARESGPILWAAPLALGVSVLLAAAPASTASVPLPDPLSSDRESASFSRCGGGARETCVVDGDTFWYRGEKIRLADINTPEVSSPGCPAEAELGARATTRLAALLNAGPFTLQAGGRSHDRFGRALFTVTRGGASLGDALVAEGLAEEWKGRRGSWC